MFLENECFTICPVSQQFTIFDLQVLPFFEFPSASCVVLRISRKFISQDFSFLEEARKQKTDLVGFPKTAVVEQNGFVPIPAHFVNPFATAELEVWFSLWISTAKALTWGYRRLEISAPWIMLGSWDSAQPLCLLLYLFLFKKKSFWSRIFSACKPVTL